MLQKSFKSLEGQSLGGVLLGGLACLYTIFTGDATEVPIEALMEHAKTAQDIAVIYQESALEVGSNGLIGIGKAGVVLVFMYKMYAKFVDARTELKKTQNDKNE